MKDLPLFFPLLAAMGTEQQITAYNSIITGPAKENECSGPENMVVILLDNGRSEIYREGTHRKTLACIRCGACLNTCPIYKNIGGYTYNTEYTDPIGSVITPFMKGFKPFGHLSFACTVCGRCTEDCPVKLPLHELLLLNREKMNETHHEKIVWKSGMWLFEKFFIKRRRFGSVNGQFKNAILKTTGSVLGNNKKNPQFAKYSFSKQWKYKSK